ncbi:hypothetical protein RIF29_01945 [Crotalaria pallida]|uniref:DUF7745 domain-containing protein n=1 Tax=Crotalaria pallida TaxID=3830 RepID=A0AAN9P7P7_CROPI
MANKNIPSEKTSNVTKKHGFNVNFIINPLGRLNSVIENLPRFVKDKFISEYDDILYLSLIEVEEPAIRTLVQYWNVKLGVFELPHIDTTPTLEEYQKLLGLFQLDKIYYQGLLTKEEDILKLLDIKDNPGIRTAQKPFSGLKQNLWKIIWSILLKIINGFLGFSGIPLIGPRSSFLYFPCLVLRQMGWTQTLPEGEIESFCLEGEESRAKEGTFLQAWRNLKILGTKELQQQIKTEVASYVAWRRARTEGFTPLIPFPKNSGPTSKEQSLQKKPRKIKDLEKENPSSTEASKRRMEDNLEEEVKNLKDQLRVKDVALSNSARKCKGLVNQIGELRQKNSHQKMNLLEMEKIVKDRDEEIRLLEKLMNCIKKEQLQDEETWKMTRERDEWQKRQIEILERQLAQNEEEHTNMMSAAKNEIERIKEVIQNTNDFHDQCKIEFNEILKRLDEELAEARHQISFLKREYGARVRQYASFSEQWLIDFDKARAEIDAPGVPWKIIRYFKEYDGMARLIRAKGKNEPEYTPTEYPPGT